MTDAIKKLAPYEPVITQVALQTTAIKRTRRALEKQMEERRASMMKARELGAPRADLANAAGVSVVRMHQILAGGVK